MLWIEQPEYNNNVSAASCSLIRQSVETLFRAVVVLSSVFILLIRDPVGHVVTSSVVDDPCR